MYPPVAYNMRILKHFESRTYVGLKVFLKYLSRKFINILNYIKSLYYVDLKYFDQRFRQKNSYTKCFNSSILYTTETHFYNSTIKNEAISFSASSETQKFHHLLGCHVLVLILHLSFFKSFTFFKFDIPS